MLVGRPPLTPLAPPPAQAGSGNRVFVALERTRTNRNPRQEPVPLVQRLPTPRPHSSRSSRSCARWSIRRNRWRRGLISDRDDVDDGFEPTEVIHVARV